MYRKIVTLRGEEMLVIEWQGSWKGLRSKEYQPTRSITVDEDGPLDSAL